MIAVEQQAKERLERLSALRKIKPVDMSTLSQQVRQEKQQPPFLVIFKVFSSAEVLVFHT